MKLLKLVLVGLVMLVNLVIAPPSWADPPRLTTTPDYTEVTQALNALLNAPDRGGYSAADFQQRVGELQLQKYILETARNWGVCRNETGQTLAIYAHKGKKSNQPSQIYYLGNGKETDDEWSCDGVFLPSGVKVAGLVPGDTQAQELAEPIALKFVNGTQLVATANPETNAIELNVPPAKVFKVGEGNLPIPNLTPIDLAAQKPNAPID